MRDMRDRDWGEGGEGREVRDKGERDRGERDRGESGGRAGCIMIRQGKTFNFWDYFYYCSYFTANRYEHGIRHSKRFPSCQFSSLIQQKQDIQGKRDF